ncbi:MAG: orotidine-5'-phosphate decarboxylase [Candidatus Sumerlaeia bacterium]|nr:orotidine-5'-phosphate decarboxylase [Candidatus Sumerlaeia bacterium]
MSAYFERLAQAIETNKTHLCIGLDLQPEHMPAGVWRDTDGFVNFARAIIEATSDLVCCYKPNLAFYEAMGGGSYHTLRKVLEAIPASIPVIADGKRGDIGNTARAYARGLFDRLGFDAATINPYLGYDSIEPFLEYNECGCYLLCLTSNPGAADFQIPHGLYLEVARRAVEWNKHGNIGLVVGATQADRIAEVRAVAPELPFLIPGVGAQGGDLEAAVRAAANGSADRGFVINVARSVLYASSGDDFVEAARREAEKIRDQIEQCLAAMDAEKQPPAETESKDSNGVITEEWTK